MLIGKFYHRLEEKGRISLPKKFRSEKNEWVVTRGLDGCLFLFTTDDFEKKLAQIANRTFTKKAHRDLIRLMTNEASEVDVDSTGRVHLPEYLIEFAQLKKDIVIVGSYSNIEIWDRDTYHEYIDNLEENAEDIAESISYDA